MADFTIRVQTSNGSSVLSGITADTAFGELMARIANHMGIDHTNFTILVGFPPKPLQLAEGDAIGSSLQSGESIRIKFLIDPAPAAAKPTKASSSRKTPTSKAKPVPAIPQRPSSGPAIHSLRGPVHLGPTPTAKVPTPPPKKRKRMNIGVQNEEDVADFMLEAVSGGTGKKNRFMRAVFRRAVEKEYDTAKANARLSSALSSKYEMTDSQNARRLGDGQSTSLHVRFHKGMGSRTYHEETVDLLNQEALRAVVTLVLQSSDPDAKEMLKPINMAGCSPRVFWSLVRLYGADVMEGLKQLLPTADWAFLDERQRFMSEKAKANFEQEQAAAERRKSKRKQATGDAGDSKRAKVEDPETTATDQKQQEETIDEVGPHEEDEGEQSDEELGVEEAKEELEEFVPSHLLDHLVLDNIAVRCLRALALREPEQLYEQLTAAGTSPSEDEIKEMVTKAREQSLDEIWFTICSQNNNLVEALESLRICTPRDLALWRLSQPELVEKINTALSQSASSSDETSTSPCVDAEQVASMMYRTQKYRKKYAWLDDWITDVQA